MQIGFLGTAVRRYKWGLLARTYIELYNYPRDHCRLHHGFHRILRQMSLGSERRRTHVQGVELDQRRFNILFLTFGGIGEALIEANYIFHFRKRFSGDNIHIDVADVHEPSIRESIFGGLRSEGIRIFGIEHEPLFEGYDAIVRIVRYPVNLRSDAEKMASTAPELKDISGIWDAFLASHETMVEAHPKMDCIGISECIAKGQKRFQQPDLEGLLGIEDLDCPIPQPNTGILGKYGLKDYEYITLNRDTGFNSRISTKLWPEESYNELTALIREHYPDVRIVAIGAPPTHGDILSGMDVDLRGKTTFEEMLELVQKSKLHISGEGLSVHIRHILSRKPSIVIFGSTSSEFYGYDENINIARPCSNGPCEWTNEDWSVKCCISEDVPPCLSSINVPEVFEHVRKTLEHP